VNLKIITPEKEILKQDSIDFFHAVLSDGNPISVYKAHAPLIALLAQGTVKYEYMQILYEFSVSEGLIKVKNDTIDCFVSWANAVEIEKSYDR